MSAASGKATGAGNPREARRKLRRIFCGLISRKVQVQERARQELAKLSDTNLVYLAQRLYSGYADRILWARTLRSALVVGLIVGFALFTMMLYFNVLGERGVGMALLLPLLYFCYRWLAPDRYNVVLGGLACVLHELREVREVPVTLNMIAGQVDLVLAGQMRMRCPALESLLPGIEADQWDADLTEGERDQWRNHLTYQLRTPFVDVKTTLETLKALEQVGDEKVLRIVQNLATMKSSELRGQMPIEAPEDVQLVQRAAQECLEAIRQRNDVLARTLLRGSEASSKDTLLRAIDTDSPATRPEELLRPKL